MKVLVIGSGGQVGCALLATAPSAFTITHASRAECDLADADAVRALIGDASPAIVINAAAYTAVDAAESDEEAARAVNAEAVANLVGAHAGKLVQIGTDFVFDGSANRPYQPDDERAPLSVYGATKAAGEDHLRPTDLLVRTSWVYGAGGRNFVTTMLRLMREKDEVRVVSDQIGSPTWANGLASTIWKLVGKEAAGTFHHSDAGVASWYDFAVAIQEEARAMGLLDRSAPIIPIRTTNYPTAARRPPFSVLDSSATRALLQDGYTHWRLNLWHMLREEKALG
ncbi:dTDP-4-dehydrorhamnose reductase [Aurantiacibacter gangjinensis]|uniref:dTDP-4-dehydrorhamnose reductase n=1 Tax=Aurantiacibacter gangjinensis TaxID=502682 RepID=A0A0G9MLD3_9SPHN|nr:dTDP-4-dehydrorhamnose reductase [Aurantiacibacter gangjinensis]APE27331.1 dTDP-4-dehydrorhamnose reductase [Aurantiacibacter gangjinensis]KLE31429.1 dTDP-4-dehydrorhamnose reductase [Aurantiacibacter gangjinensis]